jgi:pilus assembly protein CpaE
VTDPRIVAVGGTPPFAIDVVRAMGGPAETVPWLPSTSSAQRAMADGQHAFDVVVLAPAVGDDDAIALAEFAAKESPTTAVILVRDVPVDGAFPRLVRGGVRDVVDLTKGKGEFRDAMRRAVEWAGGVRGTVTASGGPRTGVVISVFSTKGGTGKTFLACNLAAALAERSGATVGLLDLDHDLGDVFSYFGAEPSRTLQELLIQDGKVDAGAVGLLGTRLGKGITGFGSLPDPRAEPISGAAITKLLGNLRVAFPFSVVDASSEYSDHVLSALDLSDAIALVTGLDAIGVRHLSIAMQTLQNLGIRRDRLQYVVNKVDSRLSLEIQDIERLLEIRVDGRIPSSPLVPRSINRGKLLWFEKRHSDVAKGIEAFADRLMAKLAPPAVDGSPGRPRARKG